MKNKFKNMAYQNLDNFIFGHSKEPVKTKNGLVIGGGKVYPEVNFTLSGIIIEEDNMDKVLKEYKEIVEDVMKRAAELYLPGLIVEIELLPPTTYNPQWGIDIIKTVRDAMNEFEASKGLKSALRVTPVDIREDRRSSHMWRGDYWDRIMKVFEKSAEAGAEFLSIESIGGKNVHDEALMYCELDKALFALGVLGCCDMSRLWSEIVAIADRTDSFAAGDTACAFANTAMVLSDQGMIPKAFSAVVRVMSAVRSLVAFEEGAVGPHKDCGYEGVYTKAITGRPISMEGKSSACAHPSPVGNIAAAVTDLWSNESVQNVKLLGGMAPTVSTEMLTYDSRLLNTATEKGKDEARLLQNLMMDSDSKYDPNAYVLRPDVVLRISEKIVKEDSHFDKTKAAARAAIDELKEGSENNKVNIDQKEFIWLERMDEQLQSLPGEEELIEKIINSTMTGKFHPEKYDL